MNNKNEINEGLLEALQALSHLINRNVYKINIGPYWHNPMAICFDQPVEQQVRKRPDCIRILRSMWRLETKESYICGSGDDRKVIEERVVQLKQKKLMTFEVTPPIYEAKFHFSNDYQLSLLPMVTGYHWDVELSDYTLLVGPDTDYRIEPVNSS